MAATKGSAGGAVNPANIAVGPRIPQGLAMAVEGLTREVLRHRPEDIYVFAAGHFEKLLQLRERHRLGLLATDKVTRSRVDTGELGTPRAKQRKKSRSRGTKSGWSLSETAKVLERHRRIFGESETRISTEDVRALAHSRNDEWTVTTTVTTTMSTTTSTVAPVSQVTHGESHRNSSGRERSRSRRRKTSSDGTAGKFVEAVIERDVRSLACFPSAGEASGSQTLKRRARDRNRTEKRVKEAHDESSKYGTSIRVSRRRRVADDTESKEKTTEVRPSAAPRMDQVKDYVVRTFASARSLEELQSAKYVEKVQDVIDKTAPIIRNKLEELKNASRVSRQTTIDIYADAGCRGANDGGNGASDASPASNGSDEEVIDNVESIDSKPTAAEEKDLAANGDDDSVTKSHFAVRRSSSCKDIRVGNNGGLQEVSKVSLPAVRPRSSKNGRAVSRNGSDQLILPPISPDALKCRKRKDDLTLPMLPVAGNLSASSSFIGANENGKDGSNGSVEKCIVSISVDGEDRAEDEDNDEGSAETDRNDAVVEEVFRDSLNVTPEIIDIPQRPDSLETEAVDEVDDEKFVENAEQNRKAGALINKLKELEVAERSVERILSLSAAANKLYNESISADVEEADEGERNGKNDNTIRKKLREVEETERRIDKILVGTEKSVLQKSNETENERIPPRSESSTHSARNDDDEPPFCYILTEGSPCEIPESVTTVIIPDRQLVSPVSEPDLDAQYEESTEQLEASTMGEEPDHLSKQNEAFGEYIRPETSHAYDDIDYLRSMKMAHDVNINRQDLDRIKEEEEGEEEEAQGNKMADEEEQEQETSSERQKEEIEEEKMNVEDEDPVCSASLLGNIPEHEEKETSILDDLKEMNGSQEAERSMEKSVAEHAELISSESNNEQKEATVTDHSTTDSSSLDPSRPIVPELNLDSLQDITISSLKPLTDNTDETTDDVENNGNENDDTSLQSCSLRVSSRRSDESHATIEHRTNDVSLDGMKSSSDVEEIIKESPLENVFVSGDSPVQIQDLHVGQSEETVEEKKKDDMEEEIAKELIESLKEDKAGVGDTNELSENVNDVTSTEKVRDLIREFVIIEETREQLSATERSQKSEDNESNNQVTDKKSPGTDAEESPKFESYEKEGQSESAEHISDNKQITSVVAEIEAKEETQVSPKNSSSDEEPTNAVSKEKDERESKEEEQNISSQGEHKSVETGVKEDDSEQVKKNGESNADAASLSVHDLLETADEVDKVKIENGNEKLSEIASVDENDYGSSNIEQASEAEQIVEEKRQDSHGSPKGGSSNESGSVKSNIEASDDKPSYEPNVDEPNVDEDVVVCKLGDAELTVEKPKVDEPTVDDSSVVKSTADEFSVAESTVEESNVAEPTAEESSVVKPKVHESSVGELTINESSITEPTVDEHSVAEPAVDKSTIAELTVAESSVIEPTVDESSVVEPTVNESNVIEPVVDESSVIEPTTDESNFVESSVHESSVNEPKVDDSSIVESMVHETSVAEPTADESINIEPTIGESDVNESTDVGPARTESTVTEPVVTKSTAAEPVADESSVAEPIRIESTGVEPVADESSVAGSTRTESTAAEGTTDESIAVEPAVIESTADESTVAEPPRTESTAAETTADESTIAKPAVIESTVDESTIAGPTQTESNVVEPTVTEPTAAEATAGESTVVEPIATGSNAVEPAADESTVAEPTRAESAVVEPTATESTAAETTADESAVVEPVAAESTVDEPVVEPTEIESTAIEHTPNESSITQSAITESSAAESLTDESAAAESALAESTVAEPKHTESPVVEPLVTESGVENGTIVEPATTESDDKSIVTESTVAKSTVAESTIAEHTITEPTITESTITEPTVTESSVNKQIVDEPVVGKPSIDEITVDESTTDEPTVDEPTDHQSTTNIPSIGGPSIDKSSTAEPSTEQSTTSSDNNTQTAATRIQAGVRGFLTRRRLRSVQQIGASTLDSIPSIQDNVTIEPEASPPESERPKMDEVCRESKIRQQRLRREDAIQKTTLSLENAFAADGVQHTGEFHDCLPLPIVVPVRSRRQEHQSSQELQDMSSSESLTATNDEPPSVPTARKGPFTRTSNIPDVVNEVLEHRIGMNAERIVELLVLQLASTADEANLQKHYLNFITSVEDACDDPTPVTTDFRSTAPKGAETSEQAEATHDHSLREPLALSESPRGIVIEEIGTSLESTANDEGKNDCDDCNGVNVSDNGSKSTDDHEKQPGP